MSMSYTDDPVADYNRYCAKQEKEMERLPTCCECGYKITDETYYDINGECICRECMTDNHEKYTEDFIE